MSLSQNKLPVTIIFTGMNGTRWDCLKTAIDACTTKMGLSRTLPSCDNTYGYWILDLWILDCSDCVRMKVQISLWHLLDPLFQQCTLKQVLINTTRFYHWYIATFHQTPLFQIKREENGATMGSIVFVISPTTEW